MEKNLAGDIMEQNTSQLIPSQLIPFCGEWSMICFPLHIYATNVPKQKFTQRTELGISMWTVDDISMAFCNLGYID